MFLIRIEKWAENLDEATLARWLRPDGSLIEGPGCAIAEIITDKADFILEAEASGRLFILAPERSVLPVGYVVGVITPDGAEPDMEALRSENEAVMESYRRRFLAPEAPPAEPASERQSSRGRVRATPAARRLARENGLDLASLDPERSWTEADVRLLLGKD